jgi:hypothetical protein
MWVRLARMARRRTISALSVAAVASFGLAAEAQASSMVYIKRGDVWLANGSGQAQRPITKDGSPRNPYRSPAYSNRGVITAVKGRRDIHFFNTRGKRTRKKRDISGGPTPPFDSVIIDHSISPDGRRLASTLWITSRSSTPRPGEPQGTDYNTSVWYTNAATGRLHSKGTTDGGQSVTWASSSTPVVFAPYVFHSADAWVVNLNDPNYPRQWFQDRATVDVLDFGDGEPLDDGEVTRAHDKVAVVRGPNTTASSGQTMIRVYAASNLVDRPSERCDLRSAPNSRIESPSWSPDGSQLAWSERNGIWVSPISDGTGECGAAPRLLIRGGSQPDWGPANVPRRR